MIQNYSRTENWAFFTKLNFLKSINLQRYRHGVNIWYFRHGLFDDIIEISKVYDTGLQRQLEFDIIPFGDQKI